MFRHVHVDDNSQPFRCFAACRASNESDASQLSTEVEVPAGRVLALQGATGAEFLIVLEGEVEVVRSGERVATAGRDPRSVRSRSRSRPRTATLIAMTPLRARVANRRESNSLLSAMPEVAARLEATRLTTGLVTQQRCRPVTLETLEVLGDADLTLMTSPPRRCRVELAITGVRIGTGAQEHLDHVETALKHRGQPRAPRAPSTVLRLRRRGDGRDRARSVFRRCRRPLARGRAGRPDVPSRFAVTIDSRDRDLARTIEPARVLFGEERQRPGVRRGVELQLLDPGELASADDPARDRVELADVLVPESQQPRRAVHRARDDLGAAQVGKIELRLECRIAQDVGNAGAGTGKVVVDLEMHASSIPEGLVATRASGYPCHRTRQRVR